MNNKNTLNDLLSSSNDKASMSSVNVSYRTMRIHHEPVYRFFHTIYINHLSGNQEMAYILFYRNLNGGRDVKSQDHLVNHVDMFTA